MTNLLICDLDGTLTRPKEGRQFPKNYSDQKPILGVPQALQAYKSKGYKIAITSNQGGIEAGFKTIYQTCLQMRYVLDLLPQVDTAYFSGEDNPDNKPWHQKLVRPFGIHRNDCYWVTREDAGQVRLGEYVEQWQLFSGGSDQFVFRKPHAGMLFAAMLDLCGDEVGHVVYTGDRPEDEAAAEMMGCEFIPAEKFRRAL